MIKDITVVLILLAGLGYTTMIVGQEQREKAEIVQYCGDWSITRHIALRQYYWDKCINR